MIITSCGKLPSSDKFGIKKDDQHSPELPSSNLSIIKSNITSEDSYIQIKGLEEQTTVLITVKDSSGNIAGSTEANYNDKVSLDSMNLTAGETYTFTAESSGYEVSRPISVEAGTDNPTFKFQKIDQNKFKYHWETDFSNKELEYSSNIPNKPEIKFLDSKIETSDYSNTENLKNKFNIILSNNKMPWSLEYTNRLFNTLATISHTKLPLTKISLSYDYIENDINIQKLEGKYIITISKYAFNNANPRIVKVDDSKGLFFSKRLFNTLVKLITNNGNNSTAVEKIFNDEYGITLKKNNIEALTGESKYNFQNFKSNEILKLLEAFAEMPKGYSKVPGLKYLLRRKDGHPHPLYPGAPAVAWPRGEKNNSYIEFMDTAFRQLSSDSGQNQTEDYLHRLIIHEKTHFIWRNILSKETRDEWIELAGWYKNSNDTDGWSNKFTTSFVSPYAHKKNPDEDFAESISYYVINPNKLESVSPEKFEFIRNRIMSGYRYFPQIREDLQFQVLNLNPDYDYPGKIKRVDISAIGSSSKDKKVRIELELLNKEGFEDGAEHAFMRISSDNDTFVDMYLHPNSENNHILVGEVTIPKSAKSGYWTTDQITVLDETGNKRMEGVNDFGFKLYINNAVEDLIPPQYVKNSLDIKVSPAKVDGKDVHKVEITWDILENKEMISNNGAYVNFISIDNPNSYAIQKYGKVDVKNNKANVIIYLTNYFPAGRYAVSYINMKDKALNYGTQYFSNNPIHEKYKIVNITTNDHDSIPPKIDLNRIHIDARPTNEDSPNGQTEVTITYYAKDNKSGLGKVSYLLIDPMGKTHHGYHYHENFYSIFFKGNPTQYKKYVIHHVLPKGSAPGTWGLKEIVANDKGGNSINYNFTELVHFDVID